MSALRNNRIAKELSTMDSWWEEAGVSVRFLDKNDNSRFLGKLKGPADSPFEGGIFEVDIELPSNYPISPPKCRFITRVWHPNVSSQTGAICLDILKDAWYASMTLKGVLLSIQLLLSAPAPTDPQDAVVANEYLNNHPQWLRTAKAWTKEYATPKTRVQPDVVLLDEAITVENDSNEPVDVEIINDEKLSALLCMGFSEEKARNALLLKNGNIESAVEYLFSQP